MQLVPTVPNGLWSIERVNRGYNGPTVLVRRASDSASLGCYSQADIIAHCAGTNGFVSRVYDQSGSARDLAQGTTASQPKIYDSVTGLLKSGRTPIMAFDGTDDVLLRTDNTSLPDGSPAITTVMGISTWTNTGVTAWSVGPDILDGVGRCWYGGHSAATTFFVSDRSSSRTWTCTDPAGFPCYVLYQKEASQSMHLIECRQNKTVLAQVSVAGAGTQVLSLGITRMGAAVQGAQWAAVNYFLHGHWNAKLIGGERDALEQVLERMRVQ